MPTPARPRNPDRPYQVTFHHRTTEPLPEAVGHLVRVAALDFAATTRLTDGTRSRQVQDWARRLGAAVSLERVS